MQGLAGEPMPILVIVLFSLVQTTRTMKHIELIQGLQSTIGKVDISHQAKPRRKNK